MGGCVAKEAELEYEQESASESHLSKHLESQLKVSEKRIKCLRERAPSKSLSSSVDSNMTNSNDASQIQLQLQLQSRISDECQCLESDLKLNLNKQDSSNNLLTKAITTKYSNQPNKTRVNELKFARNGARSVGARLFEPEKSSLNGDYQEWDNIFEFDTYASKSAAPKPPSPSGTYALNTTENGLLFDETMMLNENFAMVSTSQATMFHQKSKMVKHGFYKGRNNLHKLSSLSSLSNLQDLTKVDTRVVDNENETKIQFEIINQSGSIKFVIG